MPSYGAKRLKQTKIPVAAIGASAGGLEALQVLVKAIPSDSGICYVIIQHLSADHPTIMDQLLTAHSTLPVEMIEDGMWVRRDTIFILPPGSHLTVKQGCFHLHREETRGVRTPIDGFFTSLAEDAGRGAFCVILSGTGSDGTKGLKAIKAAGGVAIVQKTSSARFPGMPDSATATGLVDFTLKPEEMPARLIDIVEHRARLEDSGLRDRIRQDILKRLPDILDLIDGSEGHNFSNYKDGTLVRRIERRLTLLRHRSVDGFVDMLREKPEERERLLQDFLIGVTHFFRDPEAFETLRRKVIAPLARAGHARIRIWVPGCSTGEEAYTIAMLMLEEMEQSGSRAPLQVFGSDIDTAAIMHGRQGFYPHAALETMAPALAEKYFINEEGGRRAAPVLRAACVFAPHNLLQDPPFSRLNLVSCRNLLIYLNSAAQKEVVPRFHNALQPGGHMFLGPSETASSDGDLFDLIDKKHRIYKRNDRTVQRYSTIGIVRERDWKPKSKKRKQMDITNTDFDAGKADRSIELRAEAFFLSRFAAPFAVINSRSEVIYLSEGMSRFVRPRKGVPSAELDSFLARDLRMPVREVIARVKDTGEPEEIRNVVIDDGEAQMVDIKASPLEDDGLIFVVLQPLRQPDDEVLRAAAEGQNYEGREAVEHQLAVTRQRLKRIEAEYETSSQELRSTNEELLSMNEELQSANEELETSRQELQSINEELETINSELNENNEQLRRANSDIKNLFESSEVATLFLDSQYCVRGFTPRTSDLFGIRDRDVGRPVSDLAQRFAHDTLLEDIRKVSQTLEPVEREVSVSKTNQTFILRICPYRTVDDRIDGLMLSFFEITARIRYEAKLKRNARDLARQYAELETLYDTTPVGLSLVDSDLRWLRINQQLADINGFPIEEHIGKRQDELIPDIDSKISDTMLGVMQTGQASLDNEVVGFTPADPDTERTWLVDYYPVFAEGEPFAVGACVRDVTDSRRLRKDLAESLAQARESEARLTRIFEQVPAMIAIHEGPDHRYVYANPAHKAATNDRDVVGKTLTEAVPEIEGSDLAADFDRVFETGEAVERPQFTLALALDGSEAEARTFDTILRPWYDGEGNVARVMSFTFDVSDMKKMQDRKTLLLAELQHRVKNTLATVLAIIRLTGRSATDIGEMTATLSQRLDAISRTHDLLTSNEWSTLSAAEIVEAELAPFLADNGSKIEIKDQGLNLIPEVALSIGLVAHELVTNSIKYGAMSENPGTIEVTLSADRGDGQSEFLWVETAGSISADIHHQGCRFP